MPGNTKPNKNHRAKDLPIRFANAPLAHGIHIKAKKASDSNNAKPITFSFRVQILCIYQNWPFARRHHNQYHSILYGSARW